MRKNARIEFRASHTDSALLTLVAARLQRGRADTIRLLIRTAAAELGELETRGRVEGDHG